MIINAMKSVFFQLLIFQLMINNTISASLQCSDSAYPLRVLDSRIENLDSQKNQWGSCVSQCEHDQIQMESGAAIISQNPDDMSNSTFKYCRGPQIFVDPEAPPSSFELGTIQYPYRMLDDAFRELFNRKQLYSLLGNQDFDVTLYLCGGDLKNLSVTQYSTNQKIVSSNHKIFSKQMPLLVININIDIRPYFKNGSNIIITEQNVYTEIKIQEYGYQRPQQSKNVFNPTLNETGGIIDYDFNKYISKGLLDQQRQRDFKFKIIAYNSTIKAQRFYYNEILSVAGAIDTTNTLYHMHYAPFKKLELTNSIFDLVFLMAFTVEGVNMMFQNLTINVEKQVFMAISYALPVCPYFYTQGIGNNAVFNNIRFIGQNKGYGLNRMFIFALPQNVTITNCYFEDFFWPGDSYGKFSVGFYETKCTEKAYMKFIYENNTFVCSDQKIQGNMELQIMNQYSNPYLSVKIIFRRNIFINQTINSQGLGLISFTTNDKNVWIDVSHNYFEGLTHQGQGLPVIQVIGDYVKIENNTFARSTIGSAISVTSINSPLIRSLRFEQINGTTSSTQNSYLDIFNSIGTNAQEISFNGCDFKAMRALWISGSSQVRIQGLNIMNSLVSSNSLIYLTGINHLRLADVFVRNISISATAQTSLRVLQINALQSIGPDKINYINITNFTQIESQIGFFDYQGGLASQSVPSSSTQTVADVNIDPTTPLLGDVSVIISNSTFANNIMKDKLRLFTTQDIKQRGIFLSIQNSTLRENTFDKGYFFEFKHNFRQTTFIDCIIEGNNGYFLEADPSDQQSSQLVQQFYFYGLRVKNNTGRNYGLFHIRKNVKATFNQSIFEDNACFGRGVIIYAEMQNSTTDIWNSNFQRNFGYQGGVLFSETNAMIRVNSSNFTDNFAFQGGVSFLQNDGMMILNNNLYTKNYALRASLFFLYNSQNELSIQGGSISMNGFQYRKETTLEMLILYVNNQLTNETIINNIERGMFASNKQFLAFLKQKQQRIVQDAARESSNYQIQIIKATMKIKKTSRLLQVENQFNFLSMQSLSQVALDSLLISNITNLNTPIFMVDQSELIISNLIMNQTSCSVPLFDILSDSVLNATGLVVHQHYGSILNAQDSKVEIRNSNLSQIIISQASVNMIKVQNAVLLNFINLTIGMINLQRLSNFTKEDQNSIIKVRESNLFADGISAYNFDSNLLYIIGSNAEIKNSNFSDSINNYVSGLAIQADDSDMNVTQSRFYNLSGLMGTAILFSKKQNQPLHKVLNISFCEFKMINSSQGGAILTQETDALIKYSIFKTNYAGQTGASLYLSCSFSKQCTYTVEYNIFNENSAGIKGGALFYDLNQPQGLQNNLFKNNKATYGNDMASYPFKLKLIGNENDWTIPFVSGRDIQGVRTIGLYDQNNQLYNLDSDSECILYSDDLKLSISGNTKVRAERGIFNFTQINFIAKPDYHTILKFQSGAILNQRESGLTQVLSSNATSAFVLNYDKSFADGSINVGVTFRKCIPGEVSQNNKCVKCTRGTFSFDPNKTSCDGCPDRAFCPGETDIQLYPGTWRSHNHSLKIYNCFNEQACLGGNQSECGEAYTGIMCSKCKGKVKKGNQTIIYAKSTGSKCEECSPFGTQIFLMFVVFVLYMFYIFYILYNLLSNPKPNKPQTVLIRIITNYFQVVSLVRGFDLVWPSMIEESLNVFVKITDTQDSFFSMDCILHQIGVESINHYFVEVVTMGLLPLLASLISVPFWYLFNSIQKCRKRALQNKQQEEIGQNEDLDDLAQDQGASGSSSFFNQSNQIEDENHIENQRSEKGQRSGNLISQDVRKNIPNDSPNHESIDSQREGYDTKRQLIEGYKESESRRIKKKSQVLQKAFTFDPRLHENQNEDFAAPAKNNDEQQQQRSGRQISEGSEKGVDFPLRRRLKTTFFVVVLLWQPTIINYSYSLLSCINFEDGNSYLRKDTSIQCWTGFNLVLQLTISLTLILIWGIFFPIIIFLKIRENKDRLREHEILEIYGIFYIGLNDKRFYWEIIVMNIRKYVLILASTLLMNAPGTIKGYIGILALFIQRHLSHYQKPFIDPRFNEVEMIGSFASICTIFGGILFIPDDSQSGAQMTFKQNEDNFKLILFILVLLINLLFWILWLYNFISVIVRLHFQKVKNICRLFGVSLRNDIDSYEVDLQRKLEEDEQRIKFMKQQNIQFFRQNCVRDDLQEQGNAKGNKQAKQKESGMNDGEYIDSEYGEELNYQQIQEFQRNKELQRNFQKNIDLIQGTSKLNIDETWGIVKQKLPSPFSSQKFSKIHNEKNQVQQNKRSIKNSLLQIDQRSPIHYHSSLMDSLQSSQIASIQKSIQSSQNHDSNSFSAQNQPQNLEAGKADLHKYDHR